MFQTAVMMLGNGTANWTVPSWRVVDNPDRRYYLLIYFLIVLGTVVLTLFKSLAVTKVKSLAFTKVKSVDVTKIKKSSSLTRVEKTL